MKQYSADFFSGKTVFVYGAGDGCETLFSFVLDRFGITPSAILDADSKKIGEKHGVNIYSPYNFRLTAKEMENGVIIISLGDKKQYPNIINLLERMGFKYILSAMDIYEYHLPYTHSGKIDFKNNKKDIEDARKLFKDKLSLTIYDKIIEMYQTERITKIPRQKNEKQYYPRDIWINLRRSIFCGAYTGDTLPPMGLRLSVSTMVCFEPNRESFLKLRETVGNNYAFADTVILLPTGVYSSTVRLPFVERKMNSSITGNSDNHIQCCAIDDILPNFFPTYITMDIEGSELEALKGAARTIQKNHPHMAISVYHTPEHIWEIPLYINYLYNGYQLTLRNYTGYLAETILYAL